MYANIIVDISSEKLDRAFQYEVPASMEGVLREGMVVTIPFGKREISGYVVELTQQPEIDVQRIRPIKEIRSSGETVESRLIALAAWMRRQYGSTMIQALKTVLPMKEKMTAKSRKFLVLLASREKAGAYLKEMEKKKYRARARVVEALLAEGKLDYSLACQKLGCGSKLTAALEKDGIASLREEEEYRNPVKPKEKEACAAVELTSEQKSAVQGILKEWSQEKPRPCLLRGITGSGKTLVYMELMEEMLSQGKQVILLIPEISLTYQTVMRFYRRFGERISVMNSRLSQGERYDQMRRAKSGQVQIMIGPRSALFAPFPNLGLIIIDEEHEHTYKSEHSPRYHARETAIYRAELEGARVLLGSATPSLEAYYRAVSGAYALFILEGRYAGRSLPAAEIVDLKKELCAGNRSILSRRLASAIEERLQKGEQSILFLNRRGYAGFIACRLCGYVMKCPHCDVSLTEHKGGRLVCHYCGYETPKLLSCPQCGSPHIGGFKAGTQQIEEAVSHRFGEARILRMDYDTTRKKGDYEEILSVFSKREADILIGTQMIVKGHDFPGVTLVGVLAADLSLYAEDYQSGERTFQLICQAAGRAGRGERPGEAIIQTYHPEHYSIVAAARQDYEAFYREEITYRKLLRYPPTACMMAILAQGEEQELLKTAMEYLKRFALRIYPHPDLQLIGPADQAVGKVNDVYRMVLYFKHQDAAKLLAVKDKLEKYIQANTGFKKLYIQFDFDF
ncbi:MAG: primosomal protein N' [Eubacteriales bacterium]|nr:primosomal protein N' [Eubacteriales bacterium]